MSCPICREQHTQPYLKVDQYQIVQCASCGFLFVSPPPSEAERNAFYQDPGYYQGSSYGYNDYLAQRPQHEREAWQRLRRLEQLRSDTGDLLDVGCAAGFFLHVAQQRGWGITGVEWSQDMAQHASQLTGAMIVPQVQSLVATADSFDAITLWEYIEHIPDPRDELERLVPLLRPGGLLALSTPNTRYWTAVQHPEQWREFKPPAHIGFFTEATLRDLLERCGLEVITIDRVHYRAPSHPYAITRLLQLLKRLVGNGAERRTPFWWMFSLAWRAVEKSSQVWYARRWPDSEVALTLEAYARKPR